MKKTLPLILLCLLLCAPGYPVFAQSVGQSGVVQSSGWIDNGSTVTALAGRTVVVGTSATTPLVIGGAGTTSTLKMRSTSGVGVTGADIIFQTGNNGATEAMRILNSGSVGIGTASPGALLTVSGNAAALPAPPAGTLLSIGAADGTATRFTTSAFAAQPVLQLRRYDGTAALPTAVQSGEVLGSIFWGGYGATAVANNRAQLQVIATEAWTDAAQGTAGQVVLTPTGGVATAETVRFDGGGNVGIGTTGPTYRLDVAKSGASGTGRFFDQTPTSGATLVTLTPGAAQTSASTLLSIGGVVQFAGTNTTAVVAGVIGSTCPAVTCTAAYTWVRAVSSDGSTVYFPVWK